MKIQRDVGVAISNHEDFLYTSLSSLYIAAIRKANVDKVCIGMANECDGCSGSDIALCPVSAM
eukprot:9007943-Ditylum_brightwellii.AAC.1